MGDDVEEEEDSRVVSPPIATSTSHRVITSGAEPFNISSDGNDDLGIVDLGPILSGNESRDGIGDGLRQVDFPFG